jgi:hypothetical protein
MQQLYVRNKEQEKQICPGERNKALRKSLLVSGKDRHPAWISIEDLNFTKQREERKKHTKYWFGEKVQSQVCPCGI